MTKETINALSYPDCKEILHLEAKAHKWAEDECNREVSEAVQTRRSNIINRDILRIFGFMPEGFFVNGDPRGCALKIKETHAEGMVRDWGGYGMLAETIRESMKE